MVTSGAHAGRPEEMLAHQTSRRWERPAALAGGRNLLRARPRRAQLFVLAAVLVSFCACTAGVSLTANAAGGLFVTISYTSDEPLSGLQFELADAASGAPLVLVGDGQGGAAAAAQFDVAISTEPGVVRARQRVLHSLQSSARTRARASPRYHAQTSANADVSD